MWRPARIIYCSTKQYYAKRAHMQNATLPSAAAKAWRNSGIMYSTEPSTPSAPTMVPTLTKKITEGVHKRGLPLTRLAALTAGNAAKIMGLAPKKGSLMPGRDADIVVVDMDEEWVFDGTKSLSKTKSVHNIYHGAHMKGRVKQTWVRGKLVYKDGTIMADDGYGIYIPKQKKTEGAE